MKTNILKATLQEVNPAFAHRWSSDLTLELPWQYMKKEPKTLVWSENLQDEARIVYKLYPHRGPVEWMRKRLGRLRVQREFEALDVLWKGDVLCSEPVLWGYGRSLRLGRFEILGTRGVAEALSLEELSRAGQWFTGRDLRPLFASVRRMHSLGVYHGALTLRNIMVRRKYRERPDFYLIDLERARCFPGDIFGTRMMVFDLLHLSSKVFPWLGEEKRYELLHEYGLNDVQIAAIFRKLVTYRPTRFFRNRLRAEFDLRTWCWRVLSVFDSAKTGSA